MNRIKEVLKNKVNILGLEQLFEIAKILGMDIKDLIDSKKNIYDNNSKTVY